VSYVFPSKYIFIYQLVTFLQPVLHFRMNFGTSLYYNRVKTAGFLLQILTSSRLSDVEMLL